jgi:hypothetical protein
LGSHVVRNGPRDFLDFFRRAIRKIDQENQFFLMVDELDSFMHGPRPPELGGPSLVWLVRLLFCLGVIAALCQQVLEFAYHFGVEQSAGYRSDSSTK